MLIINERGTMRNIEKNQFAEYEKKGYKEVEEKSAVIEEFPIPVPEHKKGEEKPKK